MVDKTERRALRMHPMLLWDVIHRQAGTLSKSILEGVMNSIDAGGSACNITMTQHALVIEDDGKGFADRTEIENFFDTFGYPHDENDATYGRYRMGRGQLFAVGKNKWTTNKFMMDVDLKPQGKSKGDDFALGYDFRELEEGEGRPGCRIEVELYDPMNNWQFAQTKRDIEAAVAWAQIPVSLNGKVISKQPGSVKWALETDQAWIGLAPKGQLSVYNLGVLVCQLPASTFGTGGTVISKQRLDVNFARNSVQSTCPVWKQIGKTIKAQVGEKVKKSPKLDDAERERLALAIMDGDMAFSDLVKQKLLTDVTGAPRSFDILVSSTYSKLPVMVAPAGDQVGDKVMQRKLGVVLSTETLVRFGVDTLEELLTILKQRASEDLVQRRVANNTQEGYRDPVRKLLFSLNHYVTIASIDTFRAVIKAGHESVDERELTRAERALLEVVDGANRQVASAIQKWARENNMPLLPHRKLLVGRSDTAMGWTDGTDNIWVNQNLLPDARSPDGRHKLACLLLHEYMHDGPDTETHVHGVEFYRQYHDISIGTSCLPKATRYMEAKLENVTKKVDRKAGVDETLLTDEMDALVARRDKEDDEIIDQAEVDLPGPRGMRM